MTGKMSCTHCHNHLSDVPDSDGFAMIMSRDKRGRSETMSTSLSGKHDTNKPGHAGIPEAVLG